VGFFAAFKRMNITKTAIKAAPIEEATTMFIGYSFLTYLFSYSLYIKCIEMEKYIIIMLMNFLFPLLNKNRSLNQIGKRRKTI
jgi:hypothetical protein